MAEKLLNYFIFINFTLVLYININKVKKHKKEERKIITELNERLIMTHQLIKLYI